MTFFDQALVFPCAGETLVGVASIPATPVALGMVVVVGGPQYRAGSHRQFVLLARRAAAAGIATLRFDYRGMGDSNGPPIGFENVDEDIRCAIDALVSRCPAVKKVVLWGLCDGASAALIYVQRSRDARVAGVCILNPWVRTASSLARTHIKHYYGQRLMDRQFWTKLMTGGVKITGAFRELISKFRVSTTRSGAKSVAIPYQSRMALAISESRVSVLLLTSGRDFTAKEFLDFVATDSTWVGVLATAKLQRVDIAEADHTFSTAFFRGLVEDETIAWIRNLLA